MVEPGWLILKSQLSTASVNHGEQKVWKMQQNWKDLEIPLCKNVVKAIKSFKFKHMTPVQVRIQIFCKLYDSEIL